VALNSPYRMEEEERECELKLSGLKVQAFHPDLRVQLGECWRRGHGQTGGNGDFMKVAVLDALTGFRLTERNCRIWQKVRFVWLDYEGVKKKKKGSETPPSPEETGGDFNRRGDCGAAW